MGGARQSHPCQTHIGRVTPLDSVPTVLDWLNVEQSRILKDWCAAPAVAQAEREPSTRVVSEKLFFKTPPERDSRTTPFDQKAVS